MMHMAGVLIGFMALVIVLVVGGLLAMHLVGGRQVDDDH